MRQRLQPGDVLLSIKGRIGAVGWIEPGSEDLGDPGWIAGQTFVILRPRKGGPIHDAIILARYLSSPLAQQLLTSLAGGTTVQLLQMTDLRKLPILLPSLAEQERIMKEYAELLAIHQQIEELRSGPSGWFMSLAYESN